MSQAAYQKSVLVGTTTLSSTDGTTAFDEVPGNSATLNLAGDVLDDTDFTSTGFRSRVIGLRDWNISVPSWQDGSNTALSTIRSAWFNRTRLTVRYLPDGSKGFHGEVQVESYNLSGDVGSLESVDISLQADGALSTV